MNTRDPPALGKHERTQSAGARQKPRSGVLTFMQPRSGTLMFMQNRSAHALIQVNPAQAILWRPCKPGYSNNSDIYAKPVASKKEQGLDRHLMSVGQTSYGGIELLHSPSITVPHPRVQPTAHSPIQTRHHSMPRCEDHKCRLVCSRHPSERYRKQRWKPNSTIPYR